MKVRHLRGRITEAFIDELRRFDVYLEKNGGERLRPGDIVQFRTDSVIGRYSLFSTGNALWSMGSFSYSGSALPVGISVGRYCSIADKVSVMGTNHPIDRISTSPFTYQNSTAMFRNALSAHGIEPFAQRSAFVPAPPIIAHDVWIGADVLFGHGIRVGTGAVIGSRSIVTKDVPPYAIVAGSPAKVIRYRFEPEIIERLLATRWWEFSFPQLSSLSVRLPIDQYITHLEELVGRITPANEDLLEMSSLEDFLDPL